MPNIVECPICDTKYDISSLKDGMKLKCSKCKRIMGTVTDGHLLPLLESVPLNGMVGTTLQTLTGSQGDPSDPEGPLGEDPKGNPERVKSKTPSPFPTGFASGTDAQKPPTHQKLPASGPNPAGRDQSVNETVFLTPAAECGMRNPPGPVRAAECGIPNSTIRNPQLESPLLILAGVAGAATIIVVLYILMAIYPSGLRVNQSPVTTKSSPRASSNPAPTGMPGR